MFSNKQQKNEIGRKSITCVIDSGASDIELRCSIVRKPFKLSLKHYRRVVPMCFRKKCHRRICQNRLRKKQMVRHHHHHRAKNYIQDNKLSVTCGYRQTMNKLLSPISSSPQVDFKLLYEDISNDSLTNVIEKPQSYRKVNIDFYKRKESKLDTLIRRTKERERRLVEQSRLNSWYTMSPETFSNVSSEECLYSNSSDVSTLVLDREQCPNLKFEQFNYGISRPYSASSPTEDVYSNYIEKHEFKIENLKLESSVDIGSYSPISVLNYYPPVTKFEPKIELDNISWVDEGIPIIDYDD